MLNGFPVSLTGYETVIRLTVKRSMLSSLSMDGLSKETKR